nr:MmpS family protein [Mycobacterium parmense]
MLKVLSRTWIPLVIAVALVVGGFVVYRVHGLFGSQKRESYADSNMESAKPFNPKRIVYEVWGPPGTTADISYFDVNADPQRIDGAQLPWRLQITTTKAAVMGNLSAQGDSNSLGCRITVDDVVKAERVSNEVHAFTFCLVKSA